MTDEEIKGLFADKIPLFDGAFGTYVQKINPDVKDYAGYPGLNEMLSVSRPDIVLRIHGEYFAAGADFAETDTFGANAAVLSEYGIQSRVRELNLAAAGIAAAAARRFSSAGRRRYAAGSVGPTNRSVYVTGGISFDEMRNVYEEQISALYDGGVDLILFETAHDALNLKAGLAAARSVFRKKGRRLPVVVSATMDVHDKMLSGHDPAAFYAAVEHYPLAAVGFNCSGGPETMGKRLAELRRISRFPVFVMPNAGMPDENGNYSGTPEKFAEVTAGYAAAGLADAVGGCCGTLPAHIKALAERTAGLKPSFSAAPRIWTVSGVEAVFLGAEPLMVGERNNSIGSKAFRDKVSAADWDGAVSITKEQAAAGARMASLSLCLITSSMNPAISVISASLKPRVVTAGVPMRMPLVTIGGSGS